MLWRAGIAKCRICEYEHAAVLPFVEEDKNLPVNMECPNCQRMACKFVDYDEVNHKWLEEEAE